MLQTLTQSLCLFIIAVIYSTSFLYPLGGARAGMYEELPGGLVSRWGYQGCLADLEISGELVHPLRSAVVPSPDVTPGCTGRETRPPSPISCCPIT
jgi:hypothetical protein